MPVYNKFGLHPSMTNPNKHCYEALLHTIKRLFDINMGDCNPTDLPRGEENRLLELGVESRDDDGGERPVQKRVALEVLVQQALQAPGLVLGPIPGYEIPPRLPKWTPALASSHH